MLSAAVENAANEQALCYLWRRRCLRGGGVNVPIRSMQNAYFQISKPEVDLILIRCCGILLDQYHSQWEFSG